ncbi:MAG: hypothetical protein ACOYMN_13760 [Roseimicrobium sp.]
MKTKALPHSKSESVQPMPLISAEMQGMIDRMEARWAKVATWSKAKQRAYLIKLGALNADGTLRRYPMDHVPLGPKE